MSFNFGVHVTLVRRLGAEEPWRTGIGPGHHIERWSGDRKLTMIGVPGTLPLATLQSLGVDRVSYGPWGQRVALTAIADAAAEIIAGGALPEGTRALN